MGYVAGMGLEAFAADGKTRDAVERCLERISGAAVKLGDLAPELLPDQPWRDIRGLGNRLRHEYHAIRSEVIWSIVQRDLPPLRRACEGAIEAIRGGAGADVGAPAR
jgi:uncharacterized protein with HEPN domain